MTLGFATKNSAFFSQGLDTQSLHPKKARCGIKSLKDFSLNFQLTHMNSNANSAF